jgi:murein DD-endopeptidase MepM/ murein hydrolase activator NlpD
MKKHLAIAGLAGVLMTTFLSAPAAQAAERDGKCDSGEFCLYFNSNYEGSVSDFKTSIPDYGTTQPSCYEFKGSGDGKGLCVKNAAASAANKTSKPVTIYFNSDYGGYAQTIAAGSKANLNVDHLKNENASHWIGSDAPGGTEKLTYALYEASGGSITCGFDGYETTPGHHEGIDIARSAGSSVHALLAGKVINVVEGDSDSLSTIAVYNSTYDKTVIYLHSNPSVSEGDTISRDEKIAVESSRGASAAHTHVELRDGRQERAAKSVNDPTLDNDNPYPFWRARGYSIQ